MDKTTQLTQEMADDMLKELTVFYGQPVRPIKEYCDALYTWMDKIIELNGGLRAAYATPTSGSQDPGLVRFQGDSYVSHLFNIRTDIMKSNLLGRMIYDGEPLRTMKCPVHKGHWSGYSWDGCYLGCGECGWLPEEWSKEIKDLPEEELLVCLLLKNEWLHKHTDDQVKEKLSTKDKLSPWQFVFSRKVVDEYLSKRKK